MQNGCVMNYTDIYCFLYSTYTLQICKDNNNNWHFSIVFTSEYRCDINTEAQYKDPVTTKKPYTLVWTSDIHTEHFNHVLLN